ncbi:ATP-binding protein [Nitrincola iocasae]|uniref:AAA family ATPase n=1 Tax=Nitrincola iocasae TaxID=2614693 RepID=A0A5J6LB53_9GAMM|nr:ATP-binding protein [Nitrincola iocasae]QEW05904.1 AAA family ATPase [Nitrincola iocasae]
MSSLLQYVPSPILMVQPPQPLFGQGWIRTGEVKNSGHHKPERVNAEIDAILGSLYQALGHREKKKRHSEVPVYFNPAFSNTDFSLECLTKELKRSRRGRVCLFGPPGTGKTSFATYLSDQLNMPLVAHKASNLLDMFLGSTEKSLAHAFDEATEKSAVLLISAADIFLSSSAQVRHRLNVTKVHELLRQMEQYDGILLISTGLMTHPDMAAMRRFDFKIRFNYLDFEQTWMLFNNLIGRSHESALKAYPVDNIHSELQKLRLLTPGDFAAVERHHRAMGDTLTPQSLLNGLQQEHEIKTLQPGGSLALSGGN